MTSSEARPDTSEPDALRLYLGEIARYDVLTRDDEQRLGRLIRAGRNADVALAAADGLPAAEHDRLTAISEEGRRATDAFLRANLRLVVSVAKRYQSSGVPLLDLVQEGNLGLMRALEKFDFDRGFKFSTYAVWWIRQSIARAITNTGRTIRLPAHADEAVRRLHRAHGLLEAELGRSPRVDELATELDLTPTKVEEALQLGHDPMSIFEPLGADVDACLADVICDPDAVPALDELVAASLPAQVKELLGALTDRERDVICLRYGLDRGRPRSLADVGRLFGLSAMGVRHIEQRALDKLRLRSASTGLVDLLVG